MNPLSGEEGVRARLRDGTVDEEDVEVEAEEADGSPVSPGPAADVKSIAKTNKQHHKTDNNGSLQVKGKNF